MESIQTSTKKLLGISEEYTHFDADLVMHINSVFLILTQIGVGPSEGFSISDETAKWTDFIQDSLRLGAVKSFMYLKVKLLFDPPSSASVMEATNKPIDELEWRLTIASESNKTS